MNVDLNTLNIWMIAILALAVGGLAFTQFRYGRAKRAYELQLSAEMVSQLSNDAEAEAHAMVTVGSEADTYRSERLANLLLAWSEPSAQVEAPHATLAGPARDEANAKVAGEILSRFTERERQCLKLVDQHMSSKQIARELGLSPRTVDHHLEAARRRLGAVDRYAAARIFFDRLQAPSPAKPPARRRRGEPRASL